MKTLCLVILVSVFSLSAAAKRIQVHGHRGARAVRPENTISAFKYALNQGVDYLEFDLAVTKDDQLVVFHNPRINTELCKRNNKKLTKQVSIRSLTLKQVKEFDCGSLTNKRFPKQVLMPGEQIPTLAEVFDFINKSKNPHAKVIKFNIETKIFPYESQLTPSPKIFSTLLLKELEKFGMTDRTVVQSFDFRTLKWIKKLSQQKVKTSQLTYESLVNLVSAAQGIGADFVSPNWKWITAPLIKDLQKANIKVIPWTANTIDSWQYLIELNVDGIITDDPKALINYLKKQGLR